MNLKDPSWTKSLRGYRPLKIMRRALTFLLLLLVGLHSTAALCLCSHEPQPVAQHSHCHNEGAGDSHSAVDSQEQHSNPSPHSQESGHSCSCIQEANDLPYKLEVTSLHKQIKDFNWVFSSLTQNLPHNFIFQASFKTTHNLAPPESIPLYLKKHTFLI